jgi:hypothetical protein
MDGEMAVIADNLNEDAVSKDNYLSSNDHNNINARPSAVLRATRSNMAASASTAAATRTLLSTPDSARSKLDPSNLPLRAPLAHVQADRAGSSDITSFSMMGRLRFDPNQIVRSRESRHLISLETTYANTCLARHHNMQFYNK